MVNLVDRKDRKFLLQLARDAIRQYLETKTVLEPDLMAMPFELSRDRGVFITLYVDGKLKGCIGYTEPIKEIWRGVVENAINAASHDTRFSKLQKSELDKLQIEISILSDLEEIEYNDPKDLIEALNEDMGIVVRKGMATATYLPEVWQHVKDKVDFLNHLCEKAGLKQDAWLKDNIKVFSYKTDTFSEERD